VEKLQFKQEKDVYDRGYVPVLKTPSGAMVCCCGYELIKQDEMTYRCTGGSHVYDLQEGDMLIDKFGNMQMRRPEGGVAGGKKNGN